MSEIPVHSRPRRLVDWINPTGARKGHSLVDKVYKRKNLEMAWEKVKANRGSGGVDGQTLETFEVQLEQQLERLHRELREDTYQPLPVRQHLWHQHILDTEKYAADCKALFGRMIHHNPNVLRGSREEKDAIQKTRRLYTRAFS